MDTNKLFDVTYFNPLSARRAILIDGVDEEVADAVIAKFGNPSEPAFYMPEIRKESI